MRKYGINTKWLFVGIMLCLIIFLGGIILFSYLNTAVRLEHFSFVFGIISSLATAATLIWLVVERSQLQREKRDETNRRQAVGVSSWLSQRTVNKKALLTQEIIVINNNSDAPIYNIVVSVVDARNKNAKGEETPEDFRRIVDFSPPGQAYCVAPQGYGGAGFHPSIEIAFSDANSNNWVRRGNGQLEALQDAPFNHYKIDQPPVYQSVHSL